MIKPTQTPVGMPSSQNKNNGLFGLSLDLVLALVTIWLVWGSTYLAIRIAVATVPPYILISSRFLLAGAILFVFAALRGTKLPTATEWRNAAIIGGLLLAGGVGSTAIAEQRISSSLITIIIASSSIWNVLAAGFIVKEWPRKTEWLGIGIGLIGVFMLAFDGDIRAEWSSVLIQMFALTCWAIGSALGRKLKLAEGAMGSASEMLAGGVILAVLSVLRGEKMPQTFVPEAVAAWAYLVIFGSVLAYSAYMHLIRNARPSLVTSYSYINPIVAIVLGYLILHERISPIAFVAVGIILVGVVFMSLNRKA